MRPWWCRRSPARRRRRAGGTAFTYTITASNSPTSFAATNLPGGLTLNATSVSSAARPTRRHSADFVDGDQCRARVRRHADATVNAAVVVPAITSATTATGRVGTAFTYTLRRAIRRRRLRRRICRPAFRSTPPPVSSAARDRGGRLADFVDGDQRRRNERGRHPHADGNPVWPSRCSQWIRRSDGRYSVFTVTAVGAAPLTYKWYYAPR